MSFWKTWKKKDGVVTHVNHEVGERITTIREEGGKIVVEVYAEYDSQREAMSDFRGWANVCRALSDEFKDKIIP